MIEIKITTENVKEAQQEMLKLLQGTYFELPEKRTPEVIEIDSDLLKGLTEDKPAKTKTTRKSTKQKEEPKAEEPAEDTAPVEESPKEQEKSVKEEPAKEEKAAPKEEKDAPKEEPKAEQKVEEVKYPGDFADCKSDAEVLNQIRLYIDTFNRISPEHSQKAREIFNTYGVRTLPKLSLDQAIDFYEKLKAEA